MTDAIPYRCTECGATVRLARNEANQLLVTCDCEDRSQMVKVAKRTPEEWAMSDDSERLVAEIDKDLKQRAKADPRSIRDIVGASLKRELVTGEAATVERRIDEMEQRIQTLEGEIHDRRRKLAAEREEKNWLESMLDDIEGGNDE